MLFVNLVFKTYQNSISLPLTWRLQTATLVICVTCFATLAPCTWPLNMPGTLLTGYCFLGTKHLLLHKASHFLVGPVTSWYGLCPTRPKDSLNVCLYGCDITGLWASQSTAVCCSLCHSSRNCLWGKILENPEDNSQCASMVEDILFFLISHNLTVTLRVEYQALEVKVQAGIHCKSFSCQDLLVVRDATTAELMQS